MRLLNRLFFLSLSLQLAAGSTCSWDKCNTWSDDKNVITAHLIPHTHDDLGWIKTADQYFYGARPDLVPVAVQYIYNTVIDELLKNPERRFSFAETGFLWRWYTSVGDSERHQLQKLVKNGQIELIGGGWAQNDEAASHYIDIIDQMTFGLKKLEQLFGECGKPIVGWQIDPFGHSREMANIYAQMGYTSLFFARMHYLEKEARLKNKTLEFIWNSSDDLKTQILTGGFFQDNYGPPEGFCFDVLCGDDPIMDNPELEELNVEEKVNAFIKHVKNQVTYQRTNHVMLLMGSDFQYTNANSWYTNLDKLIKYVNANETNGVKVIYSTPACYTKALLHARPQLTTKSDDFFPYASANHSYWTGYFTSRPTFKGMIREASNYLQLAKRLDVLAELGATDASDIEVMQKASALVQHHDAVTGTAKENVTKDYEKQLARGMNELEVVINDFFKKINPSSISSNFELCPLRNETICTVIKNRSTFAVAVFNPLGRTQLTTIRIPLYATSAVVKDANETVIKSQITKVFQVPSLQATNQAPYELHFPATLLPLGYTTFFVSTSNENSSVTHSVKPVKANVQLENDILRVTFDEKGYISNVFNKKTNETNSLKQEFFYYEGVDNSSSQPSGAYIFRPKEQSPVAFTDTIKIEQVQGELANEVRQTFSPWISQTVRLSPGKAYVEFEWVVGPIPKEANGKLVTKEVITRYVTGIKSGPDFYTDSNGRQTLHRKQKHDEWFTYEDTEPVAGNYYPVTSHAYIKDDKTQFSVLVDRAEGATANEGTVEVMLHRRCFYDDHFGVEEALDEPGTNGKGLVVKGSHTVFFAGSADASGIMRPLAVEKFHQPIIVFAPYNKPKKFKFNRSLQWSGLTRDIPSFAHLLTMERWNKDRILLRFEHIYQNYEGKNSCPQTLDLSGLFSNFDIVELHELMLGANRNQTQPLHHVSSGMVVELNPMEIRTYEAVIKRK